MATVVRLLLHRLVFFCSACAEQLSPRHAQPIGLVAGKLLRDCDVCGRHVDTDGVFIGGNAATLEFLR